MTEIVTTTSTTTNSTNVDFTAETETAARPFLVREFAVEAEISDGRTIDVRLVPFDEIATVADPPHFRPYREQWMPGALSNQERAAHRILLNFEHEPGIGGIVGHGVSLREASDGYHGTFRLHDTADGEKARVLVEEHVLTGVSTEFLALKSVRTSDGVVQRVRAHVDKLSLTRKPAYTKAAVLALREEVVLDEELLPIDPDPEVLERCRRLGLALPQRYQAQPAQTDTPLDELSDTSADGTRPID